MTRSLSIQTLLAASVFLAACSASAPRQHSSDSGELSILTFNIRYDNPNDGDDAWPKRADWVTKTIKAVNPDVFGLQEALLHQVEHIADELPQYKWVGVGRDDGREAGEFSPLFYRADRLELLASQTWWLSRTPADTGSVGWDAALPRVATAARLALQISGVTREVTVVNTHFDHRGEMARTRSAALLADSLRGRPQGYPDGGLQFC